MFQFRRFPTICYLIHKELLEYCSSGFPHSEIPGSMTAFVSPRLIVDRYVLHRLPMPRHPPCALISLTFRQIMCPSVIVNFLNVIVVNSFTYLKVLDIFVNLVVSFHIYLYSVFKVHLDFQFEMDFVAAALYFCTSKAKNSF